MAKYEKIIDRFDGGFDDGKRSNDVRKYAITSHFNAFSYPNRLVPQYATRALNNEDKTKKIIRFLYAPTASGGSTFKLFGFGAHDVGGADRVEIYRYLSGSGWQTPAAGSGEGNVNTRATGVFFYYKGYIYVWAGGTSLGRMITDESGAFTNAYQSITYSNVAEPVRHPADDVAYFFSDYNVHKLNGTNWTSNALVLPNDLVITSACPHGNYLAIGATSLDNVNPTSVAYLWDRDSSLSTVSDVIDFGKGKLKHLASLDGKLTAVIDNFGKVLIKQAYGSRGVLVNEVTRASTDTALPLTREVKDNILYFPMHATIGSDARRGIWAVDGNGRMTIAIVENEVESATSKTYESIYSIGDSWLICHSGDYSTNIIDTSSIDGGGYGYSSSLNSTYETTIQRGTSVSKDKKLVGVTVFFEPLPSAGEVTLKYRKDAETSWTTIFTHSTDDSVSHSAINIESSGANLPSFKEIQFQIGSVGGAVITGLKYRYEEIENDLY